MDLITKNQEFLDKHIYKLADERQMLRLAALDSPNKYDLYLIACCICNYTSELTDEEKFEVRNLRMQLYLETNNGNIAGFEHKEEDYQSTKKTGLICKNTGKVNKYGHYEFELNTHDSHMISDLWDFKRERNCLKYVDAKSFPDKLIISITRDQFNDFCKLLDDLLIQYDKNDLSSGMYYVNKSTIELVDPKDLDLPFDVYPFQLEDAKKIIQYKRILIGHEMGCIAGDAIIKIKINDKITSITLFDLYNNLSNNLYVESYVDNSFKFMPIKMVLDKGKQTILKINTTTTSIKCTLDHEILTNNGWVEASKLKLNDLIISNNNTNEFIKSIEQLEEENVYDIVIDSFIVSNFVANNLVVHNCGKTLISILVGESLGETSKVIYSTMDNLNYDDIVITDKGPLPVGKIVEENIDCKVQVMKNDETKFVNILNRSCIEE